MRVTLSVGGKFQAFHLAQELQRHDYLWRLLTTYFGYNARGMRINRDRVLTNILPELMMRVPAKVPIVKRWLDGEMYKFKFFDRWASQHIDDSDLVVAWAGFALATLRRARAIGITTVLERGSSHCVFQREIIEEEYALQGMNNTLDRRYEERGVEEYALADYISVPSRFVFRTFVEKGVEPDKIFVTPYGVDLSEFRRVPKEETRFRVIFVGSGIFRKGLHYLLQAVYGLNLRDLDVWVIANIADEMKPCMARYQGSYRYIGVVPFLELYRYYSQGSVFVLPSIEEGMALVLLQAMACGLPVICTSNTGGEDIIRNGIEGFIMPIRDPDALREKIMLLYQNRELTDEMGRNAQKRAEEYTWERYGDAMIACYRNIRGCSRRSVGSRF